MSIMTETMAVPLKPTTAELLLVLRRRRGWSRAEVAKRLGNLITARAVRSWEEGRHAPKPAAEEVILALINKETRRDK